MNELIEEVKNKFEEKEKTIESQRLMIETLNHEKSLLNQQLATQKGQLIELEAKWSKMEQLLKKVQQ